MQNMSHMLLERVIPIQNKKAKAGADNLPNSVSLTQAHFYSCRSSETVMNGGTVKLQQCLTNTDDKWERA